MRTSTRPAPLSAEPDSGRSRLVPSWRTVVLAAAAGAVLLGSAAATPSASAAARPDAAGAVTGKIINRSNSNALTTYYGTKKAGDELITVDRDVWHYADDWTFVPVPNSEYYRIKMSGSNNCVKRTTNSSGSRIFATLTACGAGSAGTDQQWSLGRGGANADGAVTISPHDHDDEALALRADNDSWHYVDVKGRDATDSRQLWHVPASPGPAPGSYSATVEQSRQNKQSVTGRHRGDAWVYPSVTVTNTGTRNLGKQKIVVTAPKGIRFQEDSLTSLVPGQDDETRHACTRSADRSTLTCDNVDLGAGAGDSVVLYPRVGVDSSAAMGDKDVTFKLGDPEFTSGDATVNVSA
ncbi:hypothetical protein [Streptomyces longisporoflavus]|uniref:Ricin B lectin domain-containing protein n=1 Tax=Streptomyces longisporoflavus TaxID=28044 RepID=A0ABW7R5B9_9ACTN